MSASPTRVGLTGGALRFFETRYHATAKIMATAMTPPIAPPTIPPIGNGEAAGPGEGLVDFLINQNRKLGTNSSGN